MAYIMELGSGMLYAAESFWKIDVRNGESCEVSRCPGSDEQRQKPLLFRQNS